MLRQLLRAKNVAWTQDMDDYLKTQSTKKFLKDIAIDLGLKVNHVYSRMEKLGLSKERRTVKRQFLKGVDSWSPETSAYFAGLIDGEGTISCHYRRGNSGNLHLRPTVTVSNTSFALMQWLETIGMRGTLSQNSNGNLYWRCSVSGFQCQTLIAKMRPYLIIKTRHADIVSEIIALRFQQPLHELPTPRIMSLLAELKDLNTQGSMLLDELRRAGVSLTSLRPSSALLPKT